MEKKPICPTCNSPEMHPTKNLLLVCRHKVHNQGNWHSWCLVCAGYYDANLNYVENERKFERENPTAKENGWFIDNGN